MRCEVGRALFGALSLTLLMTAPRAHAWEIYIAEDSDGTPVRWSTDHLTITFDSTPPEELTAEAAQDIIRKSYQTWSTIGCDGTTDIFGFDFDGPRTGLKVGYVPGVTNHNLVIWVRDESDWEHPANVTALTSLTYDTFTGEIVDADLEFNDAHFRFSSTAASATADLANTTVHEAGHVLGLNHSRINEATMYETALLGEDKKRDLHEDDISGFCALYGPNAISVATTPVAPGRGCQAGNHTGSAAPAWLALFGLLVLLARRRSVARQG